MFSQHFLNFPQHRTPFLGEFNAYFAAMSLKELPLPLLASQSFRILRACRNG